MAEPGTSGEPVRVTSRYEMPADPGAGSGETPQLPELMDRVTREVASELLSVEVNTPPEVAERSPDSAS